MPALLALNGDYQGQALLVDQEVFSIGRLESNHLTLNDGQVSSNHCAILRRGNAYVFKDFESTNGSIVNEQTIDEVVLKHGDRIQIGLAEFQYIDDGHFEDLTDTPSTLSESPFGETGPSASEVRELDHTQQIDLSPSEAEAMARKQESILVTPADLRGDSVFAELEQPTPEPEGKPATEPNPAVSERSSGIEPKVRKKKLPIKRKQKKSPVLKSQPQEIDDFDEDEFQEEDASGSVEFDAASNTEPQAVYGVISLIGFGLLSLLVLIYVTLVT